MDFIEKNGCKISAFTLGTVQLGLPYGINNSHGMPTYEESKTILQTALDCGIYSFDTARTYGKSEEVLGRFFSEYDVEKTLITKVIFENETRSDIAESLFRQVKDSIKKMNLSTLPCVMLHREEYIDTYGNAIIDALEELKKEGLVKNIGISFIDKNNIDRMMNKGAFDCIQIAQNIFDNNEIKSGQIKRLASSGIAVFIRSVYLQGLFFMTPNTLPPKIKSVKNALNKIHKIADDANITMSQLALSFVHYADGIASLVLGCETPQQLLNSVANFSSPPLTEKIRNSLLEISEEIDPIVIKPWKWK